MKKKEQTESASDFRVPFSLAVQDENLLGKQWARMSLPQRVVLKAFYGMPLDTPEELKAWSILQGSCTYDELGRTTSWNPVPYEPQEYHTLVLILGRRSGKTAEILSTSLAYEMALGGHTKYVRKGQEFKAMFVAQSTDDAKKNMQFVRLIVNDSPKLAKAVANDTATSFELKNGLELTPEPATIKSARGHAIPVVLLDEFAFWYTAEGAANPDYEVLNAVRYSMLQFPNAKKLLATTPWVQEGIAYEYSRAGTNGRLLKCEQCAKDEVTICPHELKSRKKYRGVLVIRATTAQMENPTISDERLQEIYDEDPDAFPRESRAEFIASKSGFLDAQQVDNATAKGVYARGALPRRNHPEDPTPHYVASLDPAFRKDSFTFQICHHDPALGIVQDRLVEWKPKPKQPLNPVMVLDEIAQMMREFRIHVAFSDQYQLESLQQLALDRKFAIQGVDFTGSSKAKICGSFKMLLNQGRTKILDDEGLKTQLKYLERRNLQSGHVQIAAPPGKHDDLAMVTMLGAHQCLWLIAQGPKKEEKPKDIDHDHVALGLAQIQAKKRQAALERYADD